MMFRLRQGDCVELMSKMPPDCVSAIVTDPPYGLRFMGKAFDNLGDGEQQTEWHRRWAREAIRILKPGGYLVAFGGPRTYHRLACALEDVGFEIRDSIHWVFGTGFPKGQNIAKMIDKRAGVEGEVIGIAKGAGMSAKKPDGAGTFRDDAWIPKGPDLPIVSLVTEEAKRWDGWSSALKPAHEPIVLARKPFKGALIDNVLKHGTGAINIDGCRVESGASPSVNRRETSRRTGTVSTSNRSVREAEAEGRIERRGDGEASKEHRPGELLGRWPPNLIFFHHEECEFIGHEKVRGGTAFEPDSKDMNRHIYGKTKTLGRTCGYTDDDGLETVEAWRCHPDCAVRLLGEQSGECRSSGGGGTRKTIGLGYRNAPPDGGKSDQYFDKGTAARFFPCFQYTAKASSRERWFKCLTCDVVESGDGRTNHKRGDGHKTISHPTQKPIKLMQWLVRLVTPPGGVVLDPFLGSGTTGAAALAEGFKFIGFEFDPEYFEIASHRIGWEEEALDV